jgi:hypothetical protein
MTLNLSLAQKTGPLLAILLLAGAALAGRAQTSFGGGAPIDSAQIGTRYPGKTAAVDADETQEVRRIHQLNIARQKSMVSDAEKLLVLARELNAGVGAAGNVLSAAQRMKMAADIERLAHSVKEKMSYAVGTTSATPLISMPSSTWPQ